MLLSTSNFVLQVDVATSQLFSGTKVKLQQTGRNLRQALGVFKH